MIGSTSNLIGENDRGLCYRCRKPVQVHGCQFCKDCYYPHINEDWRRYSDLVEEGYPKFQAKIMAGLADPPDH